MKSIELVVGGLTKEKLLDLLEKQAIHVNPLGEQLLQSDLFHVMRKAQPIVLTELSLAEMGLTVGNTGRLDIIAGAKKIGLDSA